MFVCLKSALWQDTHADRRNLQACNNVWSGSNVWNVCQSLICLHSIEWILRSLWLLSLSLLQTVREKRENCRRTRSISTGSLASLWSNFQLDADWHGGQCGHLTPLSALILQNDFHWFSSDFQVIPNSYSKRLKRFAILWNSSKKSASNLNVIARPRAFSRSTTRS